MYVKFLRGVLVDLNKYILLVIGVIESKCFRLIWCYIIECGRNLICFFKVWGISVVWCGL